MQQAMTLETLADRNADWALRRRRLERLAVLLETSKTPVRLFSDLECYKRKERLTLRLADSALAVAYDDAFFRGEGLHGDSVADAVAFFRLSLREAHKLLCDCDYAWNEMTPGAVLNKAVASRAHKLAAKRSLGEWVASIRAFALALIGESARKVTP